MNISICSNVDRCISFFCGRTCGSDGVGNVTILDCAPCPWGWRANSPFDESEDCSLCRPCDEWFGVYDWLFVLFNMLLLFLIHAQAVFRYSVQDYFHLGCELLCVIVEVSLGFLFAILAFPPFATFSINACYNANELNLHYWYYFLQVDSLYGSFYDPFQADIENLSCIYETVYPRYSLILSGLSISFFCTVTLRPLFKHYSTRNDKSSALPLPLQYAAFSSALLTMPIYAIMFVVCGGILYVSFGYLVLMFSVVGMSLYSSLATPNNFTSILDLKSSFKHLPAIVSHLTLLLFALWTVYSWSDWSSGFIFCASIVPLLFLIATESMSHPHIQVAEKDLNRDLLETQ